VVAMVTGFRIFSHPEFPRNYTIRSKKSVKSMKK